VFPEANMLSSYIFNIKTSEIQNEELFVNDIGKNASNGLEIGLDISQDSF
jgi:hypothetical protein